jgi:capsular exopolysaccharide synthesis family protein
VSVIIIALRSLEVPCSVLWQERFNEMTQDERLIPAPTGRDLDRPLADLAQGRGYGRYGGTAPETNLREYVYVILKRKWLVLSMVLVITSLATVQAFREPSIYEGVTTIRIEAKTPPVLQTGQLLINQQDPNFWGTQIKLLQNPLLARQVVLTLGLQNNPAFLGGQAQTGLFDSLKRMFSRDRVARNEPATASGEEPIGEGELKQRAFTPDELVKLEPYEDVIAANENVEPIIGTNLVTIKYRHTNAELAQRVANTLADVFVQNNVERLVSVTSKAGMALAAEKAKYQQKVKEEREARFNFAKRYDLPLTPTENSIEKDRAKTYSAQLLEAENQRRNLIAAYESAKAAPDPFSNPEVQKDDRINKLREKMSDAQEKRSALLQVYTPEWPAVKQLDAQIKSLQADLTKAPAQVLSSMKARADAAEAHEKSLTNAYARQHGVTTAQTQHEIELAAMTQDLLTDEQYLNTVEQKERELTATGSERGTDVSVANYSRLPHEPVGPARLRNILVALVLSLLAGVGLAFLLDFLDDTVKSLDDVDRYIHLPTLALIPAVGNDRRRLRGAPAAPHGGGITTALALVDDARSAVSESYRHLRTSLLLSSAGQAPKTILVTSSQPSEGKTTTAINTAFMLAQTGADVLIIDCDLRRPRLHSNFNVSNARGLTNYLAGEMELDELLQPYEKQPNLKLLPSGPIPPNPAELLGSDEMRRLLVTLSERFTHIVVDSPPAISFTDASILSTIVDGVILVVHSGRSSRAVVRRAKQQLLDVGAHIFGVVLNNVKIEAHDYRYTGYSAYYKSDYYGEDEEGEVAGS